MSQLRTCLTLLALLGAVHGVSLLVAAAQALSTALFMNPLCVTPALLLLGADAHAQYGRWRARFGQRQSDAWSQWLRRTSVRYAGWLGVFLVLSALYSRDSTLSFVRSVYGSRLLVDDLSPNAGLVWYFFVEMFPHFRAFFTMVVNLHMLSYTVPALIKWRSDPLFAATVLVGIHALFQTYPSAGDSALYLALWSLNYPRLSTCAYATLTQTSDTPWSRACCSSTQRCSSPHSTTCGCIRARLTPTFSMPSTLCRLWAWEACCSTVCGPGGASAGSSSAWPRARAAPVCGT